MSLELNSSINRNTFFQVVDGQNTSGSLNVEIVDGNNTASVTIHANTQINSTAPGVGNLAYLSQCFYNEPNILVPILNPGSYSPGGGQITITSDTLARQLGRFYIGKTLTMLFFSVQTYSTVSTTPIPLPNEFLIPGGSSNKYGGLQTLTEFIVQPCNAPTMIAATPHNMQVILSWTAPSDGGNPITNYIVQYSLNANDWVTFQNTSNTSIPVTGLTNGLTYYFQVAGVNGYCGGDGPESGLFSNIATSTPSFSFLIVTSCGITGFVPGPPPWSRAGGNNCPNCDSNYGTSACGSNGMPYSTYALDERRKTEILKYKKNGAQMSKAQQYSMLSRNALTRKKSWATQTQTYTNPNVDKLPERESEGVTVALECIQPNVLYSLTSDCDVPGPVIPLYIDAKIPLYNYKMQVTPSSGGKQVNKMFDIASLNN